MRHIARFHYRQNRAKNLLLGNRRRRRDIGKYVRTDEETLIRQRTDLGGIGQPRLRLAFLDVGEHALPCVLVDYRADEIARLVGWARLQTAGRIDDAIEEHLVNRFEDD